MSKLTPTSSDTQYHLLESMVATRVASLTAPLFRTNVDSEGLWLSYLDNLPSDRQHYNCSCCKKFIQHYGGLVEIDNEGFVHPAVWGMGIVPDFFLSSVRAMTTLITRSTVSGVFVNDKQQWGLPVTNDWTHLSGTPTLAVHSHPLKTAHQLEAEKGQDFLILFRSLTEFSVEVVRQAVRVLEADALDRSEKTLGVAKWLLALHESLLGLNHNRRRDNLVWRAVATAPPGFCHVRSTMIGTLLEDIVSGLSYEAITARWAKKMHPLQYQRPTAPLSDGQIARANEVVGKLAAEGALSRRYAKLEEVVSYWVPEKMEAPKAKEGAGPFDFLRTQDKEQPSQINLPEKRLTWEKFREKVLPTAKKIELLVLPQNGPYFGLVTATNPDAPAILQWDGIEGLPRNPVSWFFMAYGSSPSQWQLVPQTWVNVNAICDKPSQWNAPGKFTHHGEAAFLILEGAKFATPNKGGAFFPECLKNEYHEVRATMEAYSNSQEVSGREEATANGYAIQKGENHLTFLRVNGTDRYCIDRWE